MSIDFQHDISELKKMGALVPEMVPIIEDEMDRTMTESGLMLTTIVASRIAAHSTDIGILKTAVGWPEGFMQKGSGASLFGEVKASSRASLFGVAPSIYANYVELGTRPHPVPVEPLILWASRKFGLQNEAAEAVGKSIARRIAARGTWAKGNFFLAWFHDGGESKTRALWDKIPMKVIQRWEALH